MYTSFITPRLTGKVAFITGGNRRIGPAIVRRFAAEGASVAFTYQGSADEADALIEEIESSRGIAFAIRADSSEPAALKTAIAAAINAFGPIDILVNNTGAIGTAPFEAYSLEDFDRMIGTNVRAVFVAAQAVASQMEPGGRIITIGSSAVDQTRAPSASLAALAQEAVGAFGQGLARDLRPRGITVNTIQPGLVDNDQNPADEVLATTPMGRMALCRVGKTDEIAGLAAYLASNEGALITGASIKIDGARSA